jgi:HK97 family phage prohead protease
MSMHRKYIERPFEVKSVKADGTFEGYASVYGEIDSYRDVVVAGAFNKSLDNRYRAKGRNIPMLWQHNMHMPIGIYPISNIKEDDVGFYVRGECNMEVQQGQECHALMKQGALSGLSIGYTTELDEWDEAGKTRILKEVDLWEISPVTFPAGDSARVVSVKSISGLTTLSDCEQILRDAGFTKSETAAFVSRIKALATRSDSADADSLAVKNVLQILRTKE